MTPTIITSFDPSAIDLRIIIWPFLFGLGAFLLLVSQPIGRPKPDLAERLRRLDVDERLRSSIGTRAAHPIFASRVLEAIARPILDDVGRLAQGLLRRFGLAGGADLKRKLLLSRPGVEPIQFFGEKVASALIGLALFPVMNALDIHPFGPWPPWALIVAASVGFVSPDWDLDHRLTARRMRCLMELPTILDLLTIACSAGLGLEQALTLVARQSQGIVAQELQRAVREIALGQHSLIEALELIGERNDVPELALFVGQTRAAYEQGTPFAQSLAIQAELLREQKRLRIVAEGGQASVRMILPVALFILPVLFVVLLVPAGVELLHLAG